MQLSEDAGAQLPDTLSDVDRLTPFAAQARYGAVHIPAIELSAAVNWAEQTVSWAESAVGQGAAGD